MEVDSIEEFSQTNSIFQSPSNDFRSISDTATTLSTILSTTSSKRPSKTESHYHPILSKEYSWLAPPDLLNLMYCADCRKFKPRSIFGKGFETTNKDKLNHHEKTEQHVQAVITSTKYSIQAKECYSVAFSTNLLKILPLYKAALYFGLEAIPANKFYYHCQYLKLHSIEFSATIVQTTNKGCRAFQFSISEYLKQLQLARINPAANRFFGIVIDESTDIAASKQLIIYIRYLNDQFHPKTEFLGLIPASLTDAESLYDSICRFLSSTGLNIKNCTGFTSDGASNVSGRKTGVSTRITNNDNPYLLKIHCNAHKLNLAAVDSVKGIPSLESIKATINQIYSFLHWKKTKLNEAQTNLHMKKLTAIKNINIRWLSIHEAASRLLHILPAVIVVLRKPEYRFHKKDKKYLELLTEITSFKFVALLLLVHEILYPLSILSKSLQTRDQAPYEVTKHATKAIELLKQFFVKDNNGNIINEPVNPGSLAGFMNESRARALKKVPILFNNHPDFHLSLSEGVKTVDEVEEIIILFKSKLIANLEKRFPNTQIIEAFQLLDFASYKRRKLIPRTVEWNSLGEKELQVLCNYFGHQKSVKDPTSGNTTTYPALINKFQLYEEFKLLKLDLASNEDYINGNISTEDTWASFYKTSVHVYPNFFKLWNICCTLSTNSAEAERGFSAQNLIKTKLRSRLETPTLDILLRIYLNKPILDLDTFNFEIPHQIYCTKTENQIQILPADETEEAEEDETNPLLSNPAEVSSEPIPEPITTELIHTPTFFIEFAELQRMQDEKKALIAQQPLEQAASSIPRPKNNKKRKAPPRRLLTPPPRPSTSAVKNAVPPPKFDLANDFESSEKRKAVVLSDLIPSVHDNAVVKNLMEISEEKENLSISVVRAAAAIRKATPEETRAFLEKYIQEHHLTKNSRLSGDKENELANAVSQSNPRITTQLTTLKVLIKTLTPVP